MKNFLDVAGAILIMGFVFWAGIKIETIWKSRSRIKNTHESAEKEKVMSFWRHRSTLLIGIIIAVCLIAGSIYYNWTQDKKQEELACLQMVYYRGSSIYRIKGEEGRNFKTHTEAMNYCLKVLK